MSEQLKDWPKGLRRISNVTLQRDTERPRVHVTLWRMNRGTGYADPIDMGAMTLDDFKAFAIRVAELHDEIEGRGRLLIEKLGGLKV